MFWKIGKDVKITSLFEDIQIPNSKIVKFGIKQDGQLPIGYLLKQFIEGVDLDNYLRQNSNHNLANLGDCFYQLGSCLAKIHGVELGSFGLIRSTFISGNEFLKERSTKNWQNFLITMLISRKSQLYSLEEGKTFGSVSVPHLKEIYQKTLLFFNENIDLVKDVSVPLLTHNDMHFRNIMVNEIDAQPNLAAIIDTEWALAGDPEIDLVQIESWLNFVSYKNLVVNLIPSLIDGYEQHRKISENFSDKRRLYHAIRSISYLITVFGIENPELFAANKQNILNIEKHFELLETAIDPQKQLEGIFI